MKFRWVASIMAIAVVQAALAAGPRTWTDSTGKHEIVGELVQVKSGWVQIKKSDGETTALKIDKLSLLDQAHLARIAKADAAPSDSDEAPAEIKTGRFQTSFDEHSPLTTLGQILPRLLSPSAAAKGRQEMADALHGYAYNVREETWEIFIPPDYDPSVPYGLMTFINSSDDGSPKQDWLPVLKKHRLIFAGPNNAGNKKSPTLRRIPMAVEAVHNLSKQYSIDPTRVYISGNSGGGRAASWAAMGYADIFTGAQYHVGANFYRTVNLGGGDLLAGTINIPSREWFANAQANHRYVFITGDKDFNQKSMKQIHRLMTEDGFRHCTYFQIPGGKHGAPNAEWYEKGIVALDAPLAAAAKAAFEQAPQLAERKQLGEALLAYRRAAAHGRESDFAAEAQQQASRLDTQLTEYVADIRQLIAMGEKRAAIKEIANLRKTWGAAAARQATQLADEVR